ncbi:hypothetical protein ABPG74_008268 [Tetrahymena malaccensis]
MISDNTQKQIATEEGDQEKFKEELLTSQQYQNNSYRSNEQLTENKMSSRTQNEKTISREDFNNNSVNKSQIEQIQAEHTPSYKQIVNQEFDSQQELQFNNQAVVKGTAGQRRIQSSQQKSMQLNDSFVNQQAKKIKTYLLSQKLEKPKIMQKFPFSSVGMFPHNQQNSMNFFFYDDQLVDNLKYSSTQKERKDIQQHLQQLQNRVHLLQKEDKKALIEFKNTQLQTQKLLFAKKNHEERLQLKEYIRQKKFSDQQQKLIENNIQKNYSKTNIQSRMSASRQFVRQQADLVKHQLNQLKEEQNLNHQQIMINNVQASSLIKHQRSQASSTRYAQNDDKKKQANMYYNNRIKLEENINNQKLQEYRELEEREKQLLERFQNTQLMLNSAVEDMQKVINIKINKNAYNEQIEQLKMNMINQSKIIPETQMYAQKIADSFITQVNSKRNHMHNIEFPDLSQENQLNQQQATNSGSKSAAVNNPNNFASSIYSQNSPLRTLSTQQPFTNRSDHIQTKHQNQITLDHFEEDVDSFKLKSQRFNHKRNILAKNHQNSQYSLSLADSKDPLASTTGSAQFKQININLANSQQNLTRYSSMQLNNPTQLNQNANQRSHIAQNLSMGNIATNLIIGKPFTPKQSIKKSIRQSAK